MRPGEGDAVHASCRPAAGRAAPRSRRKGERHGKGHHPRRGFGGLAAAHELRGLLGDEHPITLIDRSDRFFAGLAKLWDIVGRRSLEDGSRPLARLADKGIDYIQGDITEIDVERRAVHLGERTVEGDFLLLALGASYANPDAIRLTGSAHNLFDADRLPAIRQALEALERGTIVISVLGVPYKCPPSPYEAALLIDDWLRAHGRRGGVNIEVTTPQPSPLPIAGPQASGQVARQLAERDIALHTEHKASVVDPDKRTVSFANGEQLSFDALLAVPKHVVPAVIADSPLAGPDGWIEPDRHTMRTSFAGVYAVGDCTRIPLDPGEVPKAGLFAEVEAKVAARNIAAEITGGTGASFDGKGYCFIEMGADRAAYINGDFFAQPKPNVVISEADEKTFRDKEAFERERLDGWFG